MRGELSVFDKYCYLQKGQSRTEDRFRPEGLRAMQQEGDRHYAPYRPGRKSAQCGNTESITVNLPAAAPQQGQVPDDARSGRVPA